ncbi:MAG: YveK family protein [Peptococcales bacterium]
MQPEQQYIEGVEIDLREIFEIIKKRIALLIAIPIIAMLISGIVSYFVLTPIYEASTTLIVGRDASHQNLESEIEYTNLMAYQKLVKTYGEIAQSRTISQEVINSLDLDMSPQQLQKTISVTTVKDTELMKISVQNPSPEMAKDIANTLATVFSHRIIDIKKVDSVSVIDPAITPQNPVKPNKKLNIAIAGVLGMMLALGIIFLEEYLDNSIKSMADVEKYLQLPTLGAIPLMQEEDLKA